MSELKKVEDMINELQTNDEFLKKIASASSSEDYISVFSKYDIVLSEEEANQIVENIEKLKDVDVDEDIELKEEDLDNVNGGFAAIVICGFAVPKVLAYTMLALVATCGAVRAYKKLKKEYKF